VISFRYRDKGTVIHQLNPFCKLAWVASVVVLALILNHPLFLLFLFLSTLPMVITAKVWREWTSFMRLALYLCVAIVIVNALMSYHGTHILLEAPFRVPVMGTPVITLESTFYGVAMCLRLLAIISAFAVLTFTVHPDDMMLSMIKMGLPYKSVLVASLSTRFIPNLIQDVGRITDVQRSRGLELDKGRLPQRVKSRTRVIVPLLSNSLDRTVQIAEAMESRAFGSGTRRTFYKEIRLSLIDTFTLSFACLPLAFGIFMRLSGYGDYQYYPTLEGINLNGLEWSMLIVLILLLSTVVPLASLKRRVELD